MKEITLEQWNNARKLANHRVWFKEELGQAIINNTCLEFFEKYKLIISTVDILLR